MGLVKSLSMAMQKRAGLSAVLNQIPAKSLATLWLDGTITESEGSYYFVDKIAGNNVLITGYDFPTGWTKGFPYKSAATIDIFGQTDVPVVSLFQNIDYGNQYFTRHELQVVDGNGVETYEARVIDIVAYSEELTGYNLTKANTYFAVPSEITSNVIWVDASVASNGTGTKASPYKTLTASQYQNDKTVYIKSGTYAENHNSSTSGYWLIQGNQNIIGIGKCSISGQSLSGQVIGILNGKNANFDGIYVNDSVRKKGIYYLGAATGRNVTIKRSNINNTTQPVIGAILSLTLINTLYEGNSFAAYENTDLDISSCNIKTDQQCAAGVNGIFSIKNSNVKNITLLSGNANINVIDNTFTSGTLVKPLLNTGSYVVKHNRLTTGITASKGCSLYNVSNNKINAATSAIISIDGNVVKVKNNILISANTYNGKIFINPTEGAATIEINNNYTVNHSLTEPAIVVGNESGVNYNNVVGVISGNRAIGELDFNPNAITSVHSVVVFNNQGISIFKNYVSGGSLGIVFKNLNLDSSANFIGYNLIKNCTNGIVCKGTKNLLVNNNVIVDCTGDSVNFVENSGTNNDGSVFKNNIIVDTLAENSNYKSIHLQGATNHISNNNVIFSINNKSNFNIGASNLTLEQWHALGYDVDSDFNDPILTDFIPSAIIDGVDLGQDYGDGLDAATTWGSETTTPVIVTKQQGAAWDCGAYVH